MKPQHVVALVDCNSFYCSCERLFRPDLITTPVGVLSNNDGCFVSRTGELKKLGVKMGEPYFKVKDLCLKNNVAVFSANFSLYTNLSDRVMSILSMFTPEMEVYSVDEAFLNLSGFSKMTNLDEYGKKIKEVVYRRTGIPVSVGIGPTKTLAKLANNIAKKYPKANGVFSVLEEKKRTWSLENTLVGDIWGVGRRSREKLNNLHIKNALEFRNYKNTKLIQKIFTIVGRQIQEELCGIPRFHLSMEGQKKKEIISSRTFGTSIYDLKNLRESVANFATISCEKLRAQNSVCSVVEVMIRTNPFKNVEQYDGYDYFKMQTQTSDTRKIIKYAWAVLDKLYKEGYEYKKSMVKISGIRDSSERQLSLLEKNDPIESEKLMEVMDQINRREGTDTIKSMACGVDNKNWKMRQDKKSPRFVTGWSELAKVK